ncbi:hypothetical protein SAMN05421637_2603 [Demequina mangrovi]|uniref:Uncharacterized protein n=2 Tax=Demequina mangrovi TaxID=1043493 RepID=A0A1H7ANH6_9MICO|nr:hypothetical protein SAMN05421637_2603 [Demequina mangrovi]
MSRLGRAGGAAALSTLSALGMHMLAGGEAPSLLAVAAPLAAAFAIAAQLAGRPLGRWRLAVVVAASQVALHTTFSLGASEPTGLGGHAGHDAAALAGTLDGAAVHAHGAMPVAHAIAGAATYVGIRAADTVLGALAGIVALALDALVAALRLRPAAAPSPAPRIVPAAQGPRLVRAVALAVPSGRAPPVTA